MLIIVDRKISSGAKKILSTFGELMELQTDGITYSAISGHPDIFFCQAEDKLIVAPNLPEKYFKKLDEHKINYITGEFPVGLEYPESARYNAVATPDYLIHNFRHTDFVITRSLEDLTPVHVDQGYCRCNLLPLKDDHFITSDIGIHKVLTGFNTEGTKSQIKWNTEYGTRNTEHEKGSFSPQILYVSPKDILLPDFPHGFFGGCCGIFENKVFINGSLKFNDDGEKVESFLNSLDYEIIELDNGPLIDVGSFFFIKNW